MKIGQCLPRSSAGMTLVEVVVAMAIAAIAVGGIVGGYVSSSTSAEYSALVLVANARAMERLEETRAVKWDTASYPEVDQLVATNFPTKTVTLDVSGDGNGVIPATIETTISQLSVTPPLKRIRVDCMWKFKGARNVTNSVETCRAPDQ